MPRLLGAAIGGNLDCAGAQLANSNGNALTAESTKRGGWVFLRNGFKAQGTVNFLGSDISKGFQLLDTMPPEKAALDPRYSCEGLRNLEIE